MAEIKFKEIFNHKIKEISSEITEFVANDPSNPEAGLRMASKAEKLCRNLWQEALGWTEVTESPDGDRKQIIHKPSKWAIQEIMNRVDGRTVAAVSAEDNTATMADNVRRTAIDLANAAAKKAIDDSKS